jgi:hypothetical protein
MNENNLANLNNNSSIEILRSSPALPDFRAGALPARIFFARLKKALGQSKSPLAPISGFCLRQGARMIRPI